MGKWFDLFKTGTHVDTSGKKHDITPEIIHTIERSFNESADDAPIVTGHPKDSAPAFGWLKRVRSITADGVTKLQGLGGQIVPEFAEAVNKGMYKKVSISLRPDWTIRHVGFLGGMPPAVKGLEPVLSFAEDDGAVEFEFSEGELNFSHGWWVNDKIHQIGHFLQRLRDYFVETLGLEKADNILGQYAIDSLKEDPPPPDKEIAAAIPGGFTEHTTPGRGKEDKIMEIKKTETPAVAGVLLAAPSGEFAERVATLETQNQTLIEENKALKRKGLEDKAREFVEKATAAGRVPAKFVRGLIELVADLQEQNQEINFSETEKKTAAALLMEFIESAPVQVPTKEVGAPAADGTEDETSAEFSESNTKPERLELHKKAKALQRKEKTSFSEALERVTKGGK